MNTLPEPCEANHYLADHLSIVNDSLKRWTGKGLFDPKLTSAEAARSAFLAPYALLSHNAFEDPLFNYANRFAQKLFEMRWHEIIALPSRCSAEFVDQAERSRLLKSVTENGYIDDYRGIRISATKRRFLISKATVWDLYDHRNRFYGQAALFKEYQYLD